MFMTMLLAREHPGGDRVVVQSLLLYTRVRA
jgi:hypothetical protein